MAGGCRGPAAKFLAGLALAWACLKCGPQSLTAFLAPSSGSAPRSSLLAGVAAPDAGSPATVMHARPLTYDPPAADRDFKRLYAYGWPYFKWQDDVNPGHGEQIAVRVNPATGRPIPYKMLIEPGDTVMVMRGKDKGKITTVLKVWDKWNKILCLNANFKTKYQRPEREDEVGQKALVEEPMHVSRVMHYDEAEGKVGFVGVRFVKDPECKYGVRKERYNKATGNPIVPVDPVPEWIPVADREDGDDYMDQLKPN